MQTVETQPPGIVGKGRVEGSNFHPEVVQARAQHHRQVDIRRNGDKDRDGLDDTRSRELPLLLEPHEDRDHEEERQDVLDSFESPKDLAEDGARGVARSNLAKDDRSRQDDQESAADPQRKAEANDLGRDLEHRESLRCPDTLLSLKFDAADSPLDSLIARGIRRALPAVSYPTAEGAVLRRLEPELRESFSSPAGAKMTVWMPSWRGPSTI